MAKSTSWSGCRGQLWKGGQSLAQMLHLKEDCALAYVDLVFLLALFSDKTEEDKTEEDKT